MKISISQTVTLGSLCLLFAAGTTAFAQGDDHQGRNNDQGQYHQGQFGQGDQQGDYRHSDQYRHANQTERRRLDRLHAAYGRAASHGNYQAAERAHQHAQAIRARMHDQHQYQHQDNGQGRGNDYQGNDRHQGDDQNRSDRQGQDNHQGQGGQQDQHDQGGQQDQHN